MYYAADQVHSDPETAEKVLRENRKKARCKKKAHEQEIAAFDDYRSKMCTEYQWLYLYNRIPKETAEWIEGSILNSRSPVCYDSFAPGYSYCHQDDTYEPADDVELALARKTRETRVIQKIERYEKELTKNKLFSEEYRNASEEEREKLARDNSFVSSLLQFYATTAGAIQRLPEETDAEMHCIFVAGGNEKLNMVRYSGCMVPLKKMLTERAKTDDAFFGIIHTVYEQAKAYREKHKDEK